VQPGAINEQVSALLGGRTLAELREGQRTVDLVHAPAAGVARFNRTSSATCSSRPAAQQRIPLRLVADIREAKGPNVINRENTQRRIVIGANTSVRDLELARAALGEARSREGETARGLLPSALRASSRRSRRRRRASASLLHRGCVVVISLLLYGYFRSIDVSPRGACLNIPLALMGSTGAHLAAHR